MIKDFRLIKKSIPKTLIESTEKIINDFSSGSQEINERILSLLLKTNSIKSFKNLLLFFRLVFTNFSTIQNTLDKLEKKSKNLNLQEIKALIKNTLNSQRFRIEKLFNKIKKRVSPSVKVLTISNSFTCYQLFKLMHEKGLNPEFYILESKPGGEGKILYKNLKKAEIACVFVPDNEVKKFLPVIDIVITGADKIVPDKFFINKIGTKKLAQLARQYSKPFYVVSLREKIVKNSTKTILYPSNIRKKETTILERIKLELISETFIV